MKKTFKWLLAAVIFIAAGLLIFGNVSEILRQKVGGKSDMIHSFYELEENSVDVLCLGSSHGYSSIQANTLWSEYGLTSYVMCSPRQTVAQSYYVLREALKYQKPDILLIETYYFFYPKPYTDDAALRFAFDGMPFSDLKVEMVEDFLGDRSWKDKLSYYIPFLKYHGRWNELKESDFERRTFLHGSILDFEVYSMEEPELPTEANELPEMFYEYFEKIVELCEEEGIQIVAYSAPYGYAEDDTDGYTKRQGMNYTLETYMEEKGIPFFFFQRDNVADIDYASDFRDWAHLNTNGADKITKYIGTFLTENYGLEDHRGEDAYAYWETANQQYQKIVEETQNK